MSVRSKPNREGEAPAEPERDGSELPQGWASAFLKQVVDFKKGKKPNELRNTTADGFVPYLDIQAIQEQNIRQFADVASSRLSEPSDILVVWDGARSGLVGMAERGAIGSTIMALSAKGLDSGYLRQFIASQYDSINSNTRGTGIPHVDPEVFWNLSVPIAPLAEQRRIVGKLELLLGKVSSSQQRLSRVPGLLKRFRQSVLAAACSGKLTADWREENDDIEPASTLRDRIQSQLRRPLAANEWEEQPLDVPPTWEWVQAEDLCRRSSTITYGVLKPVWVTQGVPTVRVQDMKGGMIAVEAVGHCSPERAEKFSKTTLEVGDLLIAKDGATLGKTAFVPASLAGGNITQHVLRFPITPCVATVFVRLVIDSRHGREWMRIETKGVALPGVNVGDFRRMPIPLPPLSEQQEIVRRVEKLFAFADQIEARLRQAQAHVDRLTQSLLAKAFRGELVPTEAALAAKEGRDYETAETLLTRIRATSKEESIKPSQRKKGQVRDA